ncbi:ABC transporter permease [Flavobacterium urocaniciphilum]|uniref:Putative ABC transport system permease protein n=1 Tax=Flavobacterium urocaniciphilum TaxID=1299341 RepID=A0A1H9C7L3_9FLAO|nr:ABC transporter permease [Flavobacterium urocaniciphilum]SEP96793.1 putative ABC transport system permease protein [Flavobacterium urocaniciphilum]
MIGKLAWKNIWFKPLNTILSILLLTASVAIITVLILVEKQFEEKYQSNLDGVDLVLGAQGSPLQLVLSSVYQVDDPTGNISFDSVKVWMNHPYVKKAIPLAYGDNYVGFKIVGTTPDYIEKYQAKIAEGKVFEHNFEVVVGADVAEKLKLKLGDRFKGTHGSAAEGEVHEHGEYIIVGIASKTGKVIDNLILSNIPTVWQMHHEEGHEEVAENPAHGEPGHVHHEGEEVAGNPAHGEEGHVHHEHENDMTIDEPNMEITSVLIEFKNKMGVFMWPTLIAQNTKMQAALPTYQMNRVFDMFGVGINALKYLAFGIMLISGISIFIALFNTLKERKAEFALMRVNGAKRHQLLLVVLLESMMLCFVGYLFGTILGRIGIVLLSEASESDFKLGFDPMEIIWNKEGLLFGLTLLVGLIAALIPAIKAYTLNISKTLANA